MLSWRTAEETEQEDEIYQELTPSSGKELEVIIDCEKLKKKQLNMSGTFYSTYIIYIKTCSF